MDSSLQIILNFWSFGVLIIVVGNLVKSYNEIWKYEVGKKENRTEFWKFEEWRKKQIWKYEKWIKKTNMKSGMGKYRWMNRLPLVGRLQRCSRISLFCLHSHRTPQGRSRLNLFWGIFLEEFPEKSFSWRNSWKRVFLEEFLEKRDIYPMVHLFQVNGWQVCGTMDLTRWEKLKSNI